MQRADRLFSLVLIALGALAMIESWRMPRFGELGVHPMTAPGLTPGFIGAILLVLGVILLLRKASGDISAQASSPPVKTIGNRGYGRVGLTLMLTIGYAGGLVGRVPFWFATAVFVFLFTLVFNLNDGEGWPRRILVATLLALGTAAAVTWLFQEVFLVRLP